METFHIHIQGIVQGVGYRPFIANLAQKLNLNGTVSNGNDGVHIIFNAAEEVADYLFDYLKNNLPLKAKIFDIFINKKDHQSYNKFSIIESELGQSFGFISPDFSICEECKKELINPQNRRYLYPFITCTSCGPRYSIMNSMPFDRFNTTMSGFTMCLHCSHEYNNPQDKRYYSQTNSCHECGIAFKIKDRLGIQVDLTLKDIADKIKQGDIVAAKGIGGYLLMCDATNSTAIEKLRQRKNRPSKPLAVLFNNIVEVEKYCVLNSSEKKEVESEVAPIVLLHYRKGAILPLEIIAPGLDKIGAMLPNNGLQFLLSIFAEVPLICTSGNISGSPIIYENDDAESVLSNIYDYIITHNRQILMPQDDSVISYSHYYKRKIIIRRGRGLAPNFWKKLNTIDKIFVGSGAMMKSSFTIAKNNILYSSQFLGDLASHESCEMYNKLFLHFTNVLNTRYDKIIRDLHPNFPFDEIMKLDFSTSDIFNLQHHKAHFFALLMEHDWLYSKKNILGVVWDGIGYGEDGNIWGGEFFEYQNGKMNRLAHFANFPYLLNDKMSTQPRLAALSLCRSHSQFLNYLKNKFSSTEFDLYCKILSLDRGVKTSSLGRIFDAVGSILGLTDINEYGGQAAMLIEQLATSYFQQNELLSIQSFYTFEIKNNIVNTDIFITELFDDIINQKPNIWIAAKFHVSLIQIIKNIAKPNQCIGFSGGVWQNTLLVDLAIAYLSNDHQLYFHEQLSPNDENISVGQVGNALAMHNI